MENKIQLAHIAEERVLQRASVNRSLQVRSLDLLTQYLNEQMDGFKISQLIVVGVNADAEKKACIPSIHNLVISVLLYDQASTLLQSELFKYLLTSTKLLWYF